MHILVVSHYYPEHLGGIEVVSNNLVSRFVDRGHTVSWIASGADTQSNSGYRRIPLRASNVTERRAGVPYPIINPLDFKKIRDAAGSADLVHIHDSLYMQCALAVWFARAAGVPTVLTQHVGLIDYRNPLLRHAMSIANRTLAARVMKGVSRTVFCSDYLVWYFEKFVALRQPSLVIPNGVDTQTFKQRSIGEREEIRQRLGYDRGRSLVLFVGRFVEKKGVHLLRQACTQLNDVQFLFIGSGLHDPSSWKLPNVVVEAPLSPADLALRYSIADLVVCPYTGEGFSLVPREAVACGTRCLISTDMMPLFQPERLLTVIDRNDEAVREGIVNLLASTDTVSTEPSPNVSSWDIVADRYLELFSTLAGGG